MSNKIIFDFAVEYFGIKSDIDLFASIYNNQLPIYVAYKPDPSPMATDAFSLKWDDKLFYLFPPFSVITSCLQKIHQDKTEALLLAPYGKTQLSMVSSSSEITRETTVFSRGERTQLSSTI